MTDSHQIKTAPHPYPGKLIIVGHIQALDKMAWK